MIIKDLACFFLKKVVNNALIRVSTSLIFKDSFLGYESHIDQKTVNNGFHNTMQCV